MGATAASDSGGGDRLHGRSNHPFVRDRARGGLNLMAVAPIRVRPATSVAAP